MNQGFEPVPRTQGTVADVMSPEPVVVDVGMPVAIAAEMMRDNDIGDVMVSGSDGRLGILTDRDIATRIVAAHRHPRTPVGLVCSRELHTVRPETPLPEAIELMRTYAIRRLPVVDAGVPVGMLTLGDLAVERPFRHAETPKRFGPAGQISAGIPARRPAPGRRVRPPGRAGG